MPDDAVLDGLDPYDVMDAEAARIDTVAGGFGKAELDRASACAGWNVKDVVGHLAAGEEYNHACLDDALAALFERLGAVGVTDMNSFNAHGVAQRRDQPFGAVLDEWRQACARTRQELRQRDGQDLPTAVGPYPVRWQAFHLASELATHADDIGVPVPAADAEARREWRRRFTVFVVSEITPEVEIDLAGDGARVTYQGVAATLSSDDLIAAANGRLPADHALEPGLRAALNVVGS